MIKKTLYFGNPTYLSLRNKQIVVKLPEVEKNDTLPDNFKKASERTLPIEDVGIVVLDHKQITITQALLEALLDNNCALITCDSSHLPVGLMLPLSGNSVQTERFRAQIDASLPLKKQLWQQTIKCKIYNQMRALSTTTQAETGNMRTWVEKVRSGDPDNLEGRAAAYYWKNIFPDIPTFRRDREESPPNNLLNYGYAILRAVIARGLVSSGLLPTLGIHHHNRYNAYCLADDIMEPYRPYVDLHIKKMMDNNKEINLLTPAIKTELLAIPVIDVIIDGQRSPLMIAVTQSTASLARCYLGLRGVLKIGRKVSSFILTKSSFDLSLFMRHLNYLSLKS